MNLKGYYNQFLNKEYKSRDFYSIDVYTDYSNHLTSPFLKSIRRQIIEARTLYHRKLFYTIYFVRDGIRYYDRLFFDFDLKDEEYKSLITSEDKRKMLFNTDILEIPFNEVSIMYDYWKDEGYEPYITFSGSKGFHCLLFFNPISMNHYDEVMKQFGRLFVDKFHFKTLDFNVFTNKRQSRLPYGRHDSTDLFTTPCDINSDIDDILHESLNPTVHDFKMSDYVVHDLSDELKRGDESFSKMLLNQQRIRDKKREMEREANKDVIIHGEIDTSAINMRHLVGNVASGYYVKSMKDYDIYNCPFHDDNHHSAGCYEKRFFCSACGKSWNYYDFISERFDLNEPKEIMNEVKKHI